MRAGELSLDQPLTRATPVRSLGAIVALAFVTCGLAPVGYGAIFSRFQAYDDEGYFLLSLKDYITGHPLFTQALPIYGPFYYEAIGGVFKLLGIQPTQDAGRLITLVVWLAASVLAAVLVKRVTGNLWLAIAAQVTTFGVLATLVREPIQPAGLASLLLLLLMVAGTIETKPRAVNAAVGAMVGALLLIKINLGLFAATAVALAWAAGLPQRWRRFAVPGMVAVTLALAGALMASLRDREWVIEFALVIAMASIALGVAIGRARPADRANFSAGWLVLGAVVLVVACLGLAALSGTSLADMWNHSIVRASRFPGIFGLPVPINAGYALWAAFCAVAAIVLTGPLARFAAPPAAGLIRIWSGLMMWLFIIIPPLFVLALPLAWIAAVLPPNDSDSPTGANVRFLLAGLAVVGGLQIFPVAGTQVSMASLPVLALGAVMMSDGVRQLRAAREGALRAIANSIVGGVVLVTAVVFLLYAVATARQFSTYTPLGLPGAESLRLPSDQSNQLHSVVAAIDHNCSSFITYPGMDGFYFWTQQTPPAEVSSEVWWLVLDDAEQQSLVNRLQDQPRLCVVKNQTVIDFWAGGRPVPQRPLVEFIEQDFSAAGQFGDYELLVRRLVSS